MADDSERTVKNTIDIEVLKTTSGDTLRGINRICDTMDKDREQNKKSFDGIDRLLRGKDTENPGLIVRVDRLESYSKRIKTAIGSLITATITLGGTLLAWILGLFGSKG